jgi:hypothetical protein
MEHFVNRNRVFLVFRNIIKDNMLLSQGMDELVIKDAL